PPVALRRHAVLTLKRRHNAASRGRRQAHFADIFDSACDNAAEQGGSEEIMTRVAIIGGSGHVGTYLVPRLVEAGFEVVNVSRGQREAYTPNAAWKSVETVVID